RAMHLEGFAPTVFRRLDAVGDGAHAIIEQRRVNEARPNVQDVDDLAAEPTKAPSLVSMHYEICIALEQPGVEINDAAHELRGKDTDAAIIEQIDPVRLT